MKKSLSILLAVTILMLSLFTMNAFATETKTDALFDAIEEKKEVAVTFRTGRSEEFGDSYSAVNTVYLKGEKIAYDLNNGTLTLRTFVDGENLVSYIPAFPFVHMKVKELAFGGINLWDTIKNASDFTMEFLVFVKAYETEIDGVTYYVEEFSDRGSVINSFFYVGDELKILKAQDFEKETIQYTYFEKVSLEVDDDVFEMPKISFDFTAVMKFFLSMFMA